MGIFSINTDMGIDLGTANILVSVKGKEKIIREPSVVAINKQTNEVIAVGIEAKKMIGKTPGSIIAIRPLKNGVIADFQITQSMLKYFIKKGLSGTKLSKPRVLIGIPSGVTEVEKKAVIEAAEMSGAKDTRVIEEALAAAIGAGLPVGEATGSMVVDIGGGTTEIAVLSLGGIVISKSLRTAGDDFDNAIISKIKNTYNLMIGERTAEKIKITIGNAYYTNEDSYIEVKGRDLISGLPKTIKVTSDEIYIALKTLVGSIIDNIKNVLERTPPELSSDIMSRGIILTGGGALLTGLDKLIKEETGIHCIVADEPIDCVVKGTQTVLENNCVYDLFTNTK